MFTLGYARPVHRGALSLGVMKVGRGRHLRVWFAAAPPGGPRSNPVGYYRAGLGPGTVERESGKSRWRAGQARFSSWRLLWRATPPRFGGTEKETGSPAPAPSPGPAQRWLCVHLPKHEDLMWRRALNIDRHPEARAAQALACAR